MKTKHPEYYKDETVHFDAMYPSRQYKCLEVGGVSLTTEFISATTVRVDKDILLRIMQL